MDRVAGSDNIADALSRLIAATQKAVPFEENDETHFLYAVDSGSMEITLNDIELEAELDDTLQQLNKALKSDKWPHELSKYEAQRKTLHTLGSLIFKDNQIVLPEALRAKALQTAHAGHIGEVAMKRIMREYFWWPGMSTATEQFVKNCETCCQLARKNPPVPLCSRDLPETPWDFLQIDFLELPGCGSGEFLVVVDLYSRYLSVIEMRGTDADHTNAALCEIFKRWGVPKVIQSDNGPPFRSTTFCKFWEEKGVTVRKSVPLSPQSNGAVERQNPGITKAVAAAKLDGTNWKVAMQRYVHNHNTLIPHARLNVTPFELLVGWKFRGSFPSLWGTQNEVDRTDIREKDAEAKLQSKKYTDERRGAKESDIKVGDIVLLSRQQRAKTDPTFSSERFTVVTRHGAQVVVIGESGSQYTRNVRDVRKAPICNDVEGHGGSEHAELSEDKMDDSGEDAVLPPVLKPAGSSLRDRRILKKPTRFNDDFVYRVYE